MKVFNTFQVVPSCPNLASRDSSRWVPPPFREEGIRRKPGRSPPSSPDPASFGIWTTTNDGPRHLWWSASERRGNTLECVNGFDLKAKDLTVLDVPFSQRRSRHFYSVTGDRISIELMKSDRKLKASREGLK